MRGLIERVERGFDIELAGAIAQIVQLASGKNDFAEPGLLLSSAKVVAGAGFEPATFRL